MTKIESAKLLSDGTFELDLGFLVYGKAQYYGQKYRAALKPLLIKAGSEVILVDTGIGAPPEKMAKHLKIEKQKTLIDALSDEHVKPEEVTTVINTHLHFDHTGYNNHFLKAKHVSQLDEIRYSFHPDRFQRGAYLSSNFDKVRFEGISGDVELFEGLRILRTPGHTIGHQSVEFDLGGAKYVYTGDVAPLKENYEDRNIVGILYNPVEALNSLEKVRRLPARPIFSHDNTQTAI